MIRSARFCSSLDPQTDTGGVRCGKPDPRTLLWGGHRQDEMRDLWWQCLIALVAPFFRTSDRWAFHFMSQEMLSPRTFTVSTVSNGLLLTTIGSNFGSALANEMCTSLHFGTFS